VLIVTSFDECFGKSKFGEKTKIIGLLEKKMWPLKRTILKPNRVRPKKTGAVVALLR